MNTGLTYHAALVESQLADGGQAYRAQCICDANIPAVVLLQSSQRHNPRTRNIMTSTGMSRSSSESAAARSYCAQNGVVIRSSCCGS